jgi:type IV pilus assembly protein PilE
MNNKQHGFTLIEVMIVCALIAVLAAIAIPNYQGYMIRAACEDAKATLAGAASAMERFRAQNNRYLLAAETLAQANTRLAGFGYSQSPVDGAAQFDIRLTAVTATAYTLEATPQATSRLANRGTITLDSVGVRNATNGTVNPGFLAADVWNSSCRGL